MVGIRTNEQERALSGSGSSIMCAVIWLTYRHNINEMNTSYFQNYSYVDCGSPSGCSQYSLTCIKSVYLFLGFTNICTTPLSQQKHKYKYSYRIRNICKVRQLSLLPLQDPYHIPVEKLLIYAAFFSLILWTKFLSQIRNRIVCNAGQYW